AAIAELRERDADAALLAINAGPFERLAAHRWPTIALIDGPALGGGCELALACDFRLASANAVFGQPEPSLGIIAGAGANWRLPQLAGLATARRMLYAGARLDASEALATGLVDEIVPAAEHLHERGRALADTIAKRSWRALELTKLALRSACPSTTTFDLAAQAVLFDGDDKRTRMTAFLERRKRRRQYCAAPRRAPVRTAPARYGPGLTPPPPGLWGSCPPPAPTRARCAPPRATPPAQPCAPSPSLSAPRSSRTSPSTCAATWRSSPNSAPAPAPPAATPPWTGTAAPPPWPPTRATPPVHRPTPPRCPAARPNPSPLAAYASKAARHLPDAPLLPDGAAEPLGRGGTFAGRHVLAPRLGVAVQINAFNFPVWGMLEKFAPAFLAGMPSVVKPAAQTAYLTELVVRRIIESGILPAGTLSLLCAGPAGLLDALTPQDTLSFTGSATTALALRTHPVVAGRSVPFNAEA